MALKSPVIVWLRQDLRRQDNPALAAAAATGRPVLPLFILDDAAAGEWRLGGAARWWLDKALAALDLPLVIRRGRSEEVLDALLAETGAKAVFWNRRLAGWAVRQDRSIKTSLQDRGIEVRSFAALTLREPWDVRQASGAPYKVYTPYSKAWLQLDPPRDPVEVPAKITFAEADGLAREALGLHPAAPDWSEGLKETFTVSEAAAAGRLGQFLKDSLFAYKTARDLPAEHGTSMLSPYLAAGVISPHQIYAAVVRHAEARRGSIDAALPFIRQLIWRDFAYSNLYHFEHLPDRSLRGEFEDYPWRQDAAALATWQQGRTGFPIVDAGMRQLWQTGYMHNRVRMIVGSFLTKDLLIHWRQGATWFWDTLCDADLANNSMGWQWVAGCGIDAAPYFRIFNPTTQSRKFDPEGHYIRRFVPELAGLDADWIHEPAAAPRNVLEQAGIRLGDTYPQPVVDHKKARQRALEGYEKIKKAA